MVDEKEKKEEFQKEAVHHFRQNQIYDILSQPKEVQTDDYLLEEIAGRILGEGTKKEETLTKNREINEKVNTELQKVDEPTV